MRNFYLVPDSIATYVVRANSIDLFDLVAECHRFVYQKLNELVRGRFSGQQFEFLVDPIDPSATDAGGNLQGWRRVKKQKHGNT